MPSAETISKVQRLLKRLRRLLAVKNHQAKHGEGKVHHVQGNVKAKLRDRVLRVLHLK
jgi:hypothetical protein